MSVRRLPHPATLGKRVMEQLVGKAASDLVNSKYAVALTGAGMSTESGIRDYRGPNGVWTKNPEAERRALRGYEEFIRDPKGWWEQRLTGRLPGSLGDLRRAIPNQGHCALVELEKMGILKCTITQNVDALHEKAGTKSLIEYHGSVLKLRCVSCGSRFRRDEIDIDLLRSENRLPPHCPRCQGIVKPDGVSFGEPIPRDVAERSLIEAERCDLMLICGTSAVVYPFASRPRIARQKGSVIVIEVNAESTPLTAEGVSDYLIRGKTGDILPAILREVARILEKH